MWTKKERFEAVLNHELADRPPVSAWRHFTENEHSGADLFVETMLPEKLFSWDTFLYHGDRVLAVTTTVSMPKENRPFITLEF